MKMLADCVRCGRVHELDFRELSAPGAHTHWATCENTKEPVLASDRDQVPEPQAPTEADNIVADACSVFLCQPGELAEVMRRHAALASAALKFAERSAHDGKDSCGPSKRVDPAPEAGKAVLAGVEG